MPTILRKGGYRFHFYSNERSEPPHVHVVGNGGEMKIWLNPLKIASSYGVSAKEQRKVFTVAMEQRTNFLEKWHEFASRKS